MKIQVVKNLGSIKPAFNTDYELFKKIPNNEIFEIEYKKKRNINFHRKMFALLNLCFQNQSLFDNFEDMRYCLLLESGQSEFKNNAITGEIFKVPKSLQFNKMDEIEFTEVYESVRNYISKWLGIENEEIEQEINQYF